MTPVCYTFRRCPYAIRARMALDYASIDLEYREIIFSHKPPAMLAASPKGTVPVLILADGTVIDESWDIMLWCMGQNDPDGWMQKDPVFLQNLNQLVEENDGEFKDHLDRYKYADRYPEMSAETYRFRGEQFIQKLENRLTTHKYLLGERCSLADMALFPFVRQFSMVDKHWFDQAPYPKLRNWLEGILSSDRFQRMMTKRPLWKFDAVA